MYSDSDIEAAVNAGALDRTAAESFRAYVAAGRSTSIVDEEHFRLISGFNDIFVTIAALLLLSAVAGLGATFRTAVMPCLLVACTAWGLAEFFTARRRMALPSIVLLLAFVGGVFGTAAALMGQLTNVSGLSRQLSTESFTASILAVSAACAAVAAWLHWRRFHVPITVAAGAAAAVGLAMALLWSAVTPPASNIYPLLFVAGLIVFALAMRWDMSDPARVTRRADVAFWLHLLAAPLIVHPVFYMLGLIGGSTSVPKALLVVMLYACLGLVSLAIDRRAPMVSALAYVLFALNLLFREFGGISANVALTALVIGSALLLLSAFWHRARAAVVGRLPNNLRARLPLLDRPIQPA